MNRKLLSILKDKYIYIDIDGTLAEYRFNGHLSAKDGTTNGMTLQEIENHVFLHSRPLKTVISTLKKCHSKSIRICGAVISPTELVDKMEWLSKHCKEIRFNSYFWFVPDEYWNTFLDYFHAIKNSSKLNTTYGTILKGTKDNMWDYLIQHNFTDLDKVVFIDDVLPYLKHAEERGITSIHISSFIN